jgi:peptidoglycan/xylan/chitin deacetylase (PgdA/CDA1 family)
MPTVVSPDGPPLNPVKVALSNCVVVTGIDRVLLGLQRFVNRNGHVRAVNYHAVPQWHAESFRRQLEWYRKNFSSVGLDDLDALFATSTWKKDKPGLIVSFDDGRRDNVDVALPLLEEYGFIGWFFIPVGFVEAPPREQFTFAQTQRIFRLPQDEKADRLAMTWDEIRDLDRRGHVVSCHTWTHCRLNESVPGDQQEREIAGAKSKIEQEIGRNVAAFGWVGGEESSFSAAAAHRVADAGFRYGFMNANAVITPKTNPLQLQRTNVEAVWPIEVVRFQLCGLMDAYSWRKRRRVDRLTRTE